MEAFLAKVAEINGSVNGVVCGAASRYLQIQWYFVQ